MGPELTLPRKPSQQPYSQRPDDGRGPNADEQMNDLWSVHTTHGPRLGHKKEWSTDTCSRVDEP